MSALVTLSMGSGSGFPGGTVAIDVSIASTGGAACTAIQWDVDFIAPLTSIASAVIGAVGTAASKTLSRSGNRCIVSGTNVNVIGDGVIATITFNVGTGPPSTPISLSGIVASDADAGEIPSTFSAGTMTLIDTLPPCITLTPEGILSGTPCGTGTFCYSVQVTDSLGATACVTCCIAVSNPPCADSSPLSAFATGGSPANPCAGAGTSVVAQKSKL